MTLDARAIGTDDKNSAAFLTGDIFVTYAKSRPSVRSDINERRPLQGASTAIKELGILIILPFRTDGKPM